MTFQVFHRLRAGPSFLHDPYLPQPSNSVWFNTELNSLNLLFSNFKVIHELDLCCDALLLVSISSCILVQHSIQTRLAFLNKRYFQPYFIPIKFSTSFQQVFNNFNIKFTLPALSITYSLN